MPECNPVPVKCLVCTNESKQLPRSDKSTRHCPYCQSIIWPKPDEEPLAAVGDFRDVQPIVREAPAAVFEAMRGSDRYLITLVDSGDNIYASAKTFRGCGQKSPYDPKPPEPHRNLLRTYPIDWVADVAIASVDFFDGARHANGWTKLV